MKRLAQKLRRKDAAPEAPTRITNDNLSEHRKRILAVGRKFKYPLQYSRHKLVINTIIIAVLALIIVGVFGWWQLYPQQNTSTFAYRVLSVVPLPVADVDGEPVRYSDYLLKFRSAEHYLQQKEQATLSGDDGARQLMYLKQQSLRDVIADTYAAKLAREQNVTVSDEELAQFLKSKRQMEGGEITERTHYAVIRDYYDWSPAEYEHVMRIKLLRQKVAYKIDERARNAADRAKSLIASSEKESWGEIVQKNSNELAGAVYGTSGLVPKTNQDGGLAAAASKLKIGQMSDIIKSSTEDGYYYSIVRLIDSNDTQVNYEFIRIPLTAFPTRIDGLYQDNKVHVYIGVSLEEDNK